jgi:hypothetical protein
MVLFRNTHHFRWDYFRTERMSLPSRAEAPTLSAEEQPSLEKLKDWIDKPPPFEQEAKTSPVFLFKPEFTWLVLREGLIYAISKFKPLEAEWYKLKNIAENQWNQSVKGWLTLYGIEENPENLCLQWEIESQDWKAKIRSAVLDAEKERLLRRTVVAIARVVQKLKMSNDDMKRGIGMLQGDIEQM